MGGAMGKVGLVCLFWFLSLGASGQSVVTGMVADSTGEGIVGAAVVVMDAADTTSIAWEYSQEDGRFWVQYHCQEGKEVLLCVQAYGYRSCYLPLAGKEVEDVGKLTLGGWHVGLGEVAVQGEMPIRYKFVRGRDEFQIPQHVEEQAFDVNGVLRQIPGLEVKGESVSIVGRGSPKFTINGMEPRPGELEQLSPRDIEKVYIDRTPSSRYGKEVKGVIDIVTRKRLKDGLNMKLFSLYLFRFSPLHRFIQNHAVGCVFCRERVAPILHAEHYERSCPVVAHATFSAWGHTYYATFFNREHLSVHLELTLSRKEEIKFFMVLVCMKESRFCSRLEHLEGELTARCLKCRASEHLSRNLHFGRKLYHIVTQFTQFANAYCVEVFGCCHILNCFHFCNFFIRFII